MCVHVSEFPLGEPTVALWFPVLRLFLHCWSAIENLKKKIFLHAVHSKEIKPKNLFSFRTIGLKTIATILFFS